ncbi:MAG: HAD-IIA family hydrolase [Candidatus Poribacteria bacterium]|nr:HAD-IIA family hydrolase [Candidatus Poribacteria bacterium]
MELILEDDADPETVGDLDSVSVNNRGYLIDMDGVVYRGNKLIPGADRFIQILLEKEIPFLFVTNNSQRSRCDVVLKLTQMGIDVEIEHIFTCAISTARFLAGQKPNGSAYVIGDAGLLTALHDHGYAINEADPDYVVVGEGRLLNFEVLEKALKLIINGSKLIATNLDPNCPTDSGLRPGCGSTVSFLETASGRQAFSVGKPSPIMMRMARKELNLRTAEVTMIGDTMETDILGGLQMGYRTVLVYSGSMDPLDLEKYPYQPVLAIPSLKDLIYEVENF